MESAPDLASHAAPVALAHGDDGGRRCGPDGNRVLVVGRGPSEASAPKARRLTAHTRQNHTHRGAEKREAPSERGKPGFLPPVGGKGPGGQGYVHHIVLMPLGPPPNLSSPSERFFPDTSLHDVWSWARRATSFSSASWAATVFACSAAGWARRATILSKHGVHDGSTGASRENTPLGLHSRVAPNVYQEPYHGPVERSLRSMVPTMALHERVVNTLLGLLPFFRPC